MERLTEKSAGYFEYDLVNGNHLAQVFADFDSFLNYNLAVMKLGEYEDAEEQGLFLRLPCKVGDVVYKPNPITMKEIVEIEIESIFITASGTNISGRTTKMKYSFCCSPSDLGKSVFTTKAEAEQALAKMKGE